MISKCRTPSRNMGSSRTKADLLTELIRLKRSQTPMGEIGRRLGLARSTAYDWLKRYEEKRGRGRIAAGRGRPATRIPTRVCKVFRGDPYRCFAPLKNVRYWSKATSGRYSRQQLIRWAQRYAVERLASTPAAVHAKRFVATSAALPAGDLLARFLLDL